MPDVWTNHPDIVRDLLKEAGFRCGADGGLLKGRDPAWTCAFDGTTMYGDLYIHHTDQLRSERQLTGHPHQRQCSEGWATGASQPLPYLISSRSGSFILDGISRPRSPGSAPRYRQAIRRGCVSSLTPRKRVWRAPSSKPEPISWRTASTRG